MIPSLSVVSFGSTLRSRRWLQLPHYLSLYADVLRAHDNWKLPRRDALFVGSEPQLFIGVRLFPWNRVLYHALSFDCCRFRELQQAKVWDFRKLIHLRTTRTDGGVSSSHIWRCMFPWIFFLRILWVLRLVNITGALATEKRQMHKFHHSTTMDRCKKCVTTCWREEKADGQPDGCLVRQVGL